MYKDPLKPPRSIISAVNGLLETVEKYLDDLIKDMVNKLPSFVPDTRDALSVISRYRTRLALWGRMRNHCKPPYRMRGVLLQLHTFLEFIIPKLEPKGVHCGIIQNCSVEQFLRVNYQQMKGTSIEDPWAPAYAC